MAIPRTMIKRIFIDQGCYGMSNDTADYAKTLIQKEIEDLATKSNEVALRWKKRKITKEILNQAAEEHTDQKMNEVITRVASQLIRTIESKAEAMVNGPKQGQTILP